MDVEQVKEALREDHTFVADKDVMVRAVAELWGESRAECERLEAALDTARGYIGRFMAGEDVRVQAAQFCAKLDEMEGL